jgi:5-methylcytosine-specific restriction endonuclease McrA
LKVRLMSELQRLNIETLRQKCKEMGIPGLSKMKKPDLIQQLETEFFRMQTLLKEKSKTELKAMCKAYDIKKLIGTKKEHMVYNILQHNTSNLMFRIVSADSMSVVDEEPRKIAILNPVPAPLSLVEQLEKQKQEIEVKLKEEIRRKEEEAEQKRLQDEARLREEERKKLDDEKREQKKKKSAIPKNVRSIIWNHYIGEDIIKHKCLCCKKVTISNTNFEVGHVLSEKNGGTLEINNLRPICFACNHSMGTENMVDFVVKFGLFIG